MLLQSREEAKFLALLNRTQEKASKLGAIATKTFHSKNKTNRRRRRIDSTDESSSQISSSNEQLNTSQQSEDVQYDWRLPKFVDTLEKWIKDLESHPQGPKKETINEYNLKVKFLRDVVNRLENERIQMESAESRKGSFSRDVPDCNGVVASGAKHQQITDFTILPHGPASTAEPIAKEIHQKLEGRRQRQIRGQLFGDGEDIYGSDYSEKDNNDQPDISKGNDLDALLKAHHQAQEKVAEDMISLTRSLKEQSLVAGEIVRKDTQVMEQSSELAQKNADKLNAERARLAERSASPCRWWIWSLLLIVCFTFIAMIWVMKFFRKRKWSDEL